MNQELSIEQVKEFIKLYDYKVPYLPEYKYYFQTEFNNDPTIFAKLADFLVSWTKYLASGKSSYKSYKMSLIDEAINYCKPHLDIINAKPVIEHGLSEKQQAYKPGIYISIDLVEANHNAFWMYALEEKVEPFKVFFEEILNEDPALLNSKSVRQYIYGNLNPKRIIQHEKRDIKTIISFLDQFFGTEYLPGEIFKINSDEIVFKIDNTEIHDEDLIQRFIVLSENFKEFLKDVIKVPFRIELFTVQQAEMDNVLIKFNISKGTKKLIEINGNRYFIYFPYLYPAHVRDERDLWFQQDGRLAKWLQ